MGLYNMKRLFLLIAGMLLLASCVDPASADYNNDPGRWAYVNGPHGEHCLVYTTGLANSQMLGMDCDTVNYVE
jgi:hypothetical protein